MVNQRVAIDHRKVDWNSDGNAAHAQHHSPDRGRCEQLQTILAPELDQGMWSLFIQRMSHTPTMRGGRFTA